MKEYRLINFPGIFEDYDYFINPPMNSAFMLIVEINILLSVPYIS